MKRNLTGTLSLVVLSLLLNAAGAYAQSAVKANVPFAFEVGTAHLPAGTYEVRTTTDAAIVIRNSQTKAGTVSNIRHEYPRNCGPKLVFHRLGDQYFLAEIWKGAGSYGMVVPLSKLEKSLKKELRLASGSSNSGEEVMIALN